MILTELSKHIPVKILSINQPNLKLALLRMGITPGTVCSLKDEAPFGDPISISVNETKIMMRRKDAAQIEVLPLSKISEPKSMGKTPMAKTLSM